MAKTDIKSSDDMIVTLNVGELKALVQEAVVSALHNGNGGGEPEKLLDAKEAAAKLGHSKIWLYRNSKRLPFSVRMGRSVRFSRKGIEKWIEAQKRI
jgi:predicted DNA-binding transcriptional regulator AlpA